LGYTYNVLWNTPGYAYASSNVFINSSLTYLNATLYPVNSLNLTIRDAVNQVILTQKFNVVVTASNVTNYSTSVGNILILNLEVGLNEIKIFNENYSESRYNVDILNNSYNNLTAYLSLSSAVSNVSFTLYNTYGAIVENAYVEQFVLSNTNYLLTMSAYSDISGKVFFSYNPSYYYLYNITHPSYTPYSFILNPPKADNYDITLQPIQGDIVYVLLNINGSHSFNNVTGILTFTYTSTEVGLTYDFWVYNLSHKICTNTSVLLANTFTCNLSSYVGIAYIYGLANSKPFYGADVTLPEIKLSDTVSIQDSSLFSALIFLLVSLAGATLGLFASIILSIVALLIIMWIGLFSPLSIAILSVLIVVGVIIGIIIRRSR
jgi:hypothetical protein